MSNILFSVLLVTYNSELSDIFKTLTSIINQEFKYFEIVLSDDGSEDNKFKQIEEFMKEHKFFNYKMVGHDKNQGTVKNLISGLENCSGKYVRDFGPGDMFYTKDSLKKLYEFMEKKQCDSCFCKVQGYIEKNGTLTEKEYIHPFDINAYKKGKKDLILKNLILYSDNVSGASTSYKTDYYLSYLKKIVGSVVYEEDIFQVYAALEGNNFEFLDECLIWYETSEGISTNKNSPFKKKIALDVEHFFDLMNLKFGENKYVQKRMRLSKLYRIDNLYLRTIVRFLYDPYAIIYLVKHYVSVIRGDYKINSKGEQWNS